MSIRAVGIGFTAFIGAFGTGIAQIIMIDSGELGVNPFLVIGLIFVGLTLLFCFVPETLNK